MTRLFIQFYVGVLIVLLLAWYINGVVLKQRADAEWARVVEKAHGGGARLVASELDAAPRESRDQLLKSMRERFDYPVEVVSRDELSSSLQQHLSGRDRVASFSPGKRQGVVVALGNGLEAVRLGPFPDYGLKAIEDSMAGWMRLAAGRLDATAPGERELVLNKLQQGFDIPLEIVGREALPVSVQGQIAVGEDAVFYREDEGLTERWFSATPLSDGTEVARFGPFPSFEQIEQKAAATTLAFVLFPAAFAIALLLRPVARQLRQVENAAKSIADGNLTARVNERKVKSAKTLAQAFNYMAGRTETMLRTQRELLQAVSHELRTPLARIHFAIALIRDAQDDEQRLPRLDALDAAAGELDDLVGELLRYVRLETGEPKLELEQVLLRPLVEELIAEQYLLHPAKKFEMSQRLDGEEFAAHADRASLQRALANLMRNAGRFATSRVVIDASEASGGLLIDIDDDGPGISESDRQRAFDPFVRLDESSGGAGLGLALVRRIVANHGGSVTAQESPLGGCRVRITLPIT